MPNYPAVLNPQSQVSYSIGGQLMTNSTVERFDEEEDDGPQPFLVLASPPLTRKNVRRLRRKNITIGACENCGTFVKTPPNTGNQWGLEVAPICFKCLGFTSGYITGEDIESDDL